MYLNQFRAQRMTLKKHRTKKHFLGKMKQTEEYDIIY
jgi:hypothetical protein